MLNLVESYTQVLKGLIDEQINRKKGLDFFVVTGVNTSEHRVNIKKLNDDLSYDDAQYIGLNLGNAKGQIKLPDVNDVVVVGFIAGSEIPIVLGTVYDDFSQEKDNKIPLSQDEYLITNQENGAYVYIKQNNDVVIKTQSNRLIISENEPSYAETNDVWIDLSGS